MSQAVPVFLGNSTTGGKRDDPAGSPLDKRSLKARGKDRPVAFEPDLTSFQRNSREMVTP